MREFHTIKSIYGNLKDFEVKELRRKLSTSSNGVESHKISIKYLEILANKPDLSLIEAQKKLYNKINVSAFRKLNQRLLDKIIDVLTYKEIVELNESYDERAKNIFVQEKKLLLADMFRYRGLFNLSDELLDQIINNVKTYECYEVLIFALYKKRIRLPGTDSIEEIKIIDADILKYQKYSLLLSYVKKLYTNLVLMHNNSELKRTIHEYKIAIKKIDSILIKVDSFTFKFYSSMINAQFKSMMGDDVNAAKGLIELLEGLKDSIVYSNNRYGTILMNISLYKRNSHEYNEAQFYLNESAKYLSRINETKVIVYYQNAVLNYMYGDLLKTQYFIKLISNLIVEKIDLRMKNRIYFFYIINLFVSGRYQEALLHLISFKHKSKNDISLEIEKKILQFMTVIELAKYDHADRIYDLLRKEKNGFATSDFRLFSNKHTHFLIGRLKKVGYDFSLLTKKDIEVLDSLSNETSIKGDYLIPFTPWFKSKLKNIPYDHSAAMKEMRKKYKAEQIELA